MCELDMKEQLRHTHPFILIVGQVACDSPRPGSSVCVIARHWPPSALQSVRRDPPSPGQLHAPTGRHDRLDARLVEVDAVPPALLSLLEGLLMRMRVLLLAGHSVGLTLLSRTVSPAGPHYCSGQQATR